MKNILKFILTITVFSLFSSYTWSQSGYSDAEINAVKISKDRTANPNGTYTLTLESFVTGEASDTRIVINPKDLYDIVFIIDGSQSSNAKPEEGSENSKMAVLYTAAKNFIDTVASKNAGHRIAVLEYGTTTKNHTPDGPISNYSTLKSKFQKGVIGKIGGNGAYAADAFNLAYNTFKDYCDSVSGKIVIFFTCGNVGDNSNTWNKDYAESVIKASYKLKRDFGATVYSVDMNDSDDNTTLMKQYLKLVSSEYPSADSFDTSISPDLVHNPAYQLHATGYSSLDQIFQTISETISSGNGANIELTSTDVVIRDLITPQFLVPDGASVKVYTASLRDITWDSADPDNEDKFVYEWNTPIEVTDGSVSILDDGTSEDKTVSITGFDHSKYWVGFHKEYTGSSEADLREVYSKRKVYTEGVYSFGSEEPHTGMKVIVKIVVAPDPDSEGGFAPTNATGSGFYVKDELIKDFANLGLVASPMDMKITLIPGSEDVKGNGRESVIFDVYDSNDEFIVSVVVPYTDGESTMVTKLSVGTKENPAIYKVVPRGSWSYRYQVKAENGDSSITKPLMIYNSSDDTFTNTNEFRFVVTDSDRFGTRSDESFKLNKFN